MGICASEEEKKTKKVDNEIKNSKVDSDNVFKLLLLGPGESGKSTFFKQVVCCYGPGFSRDYRILAIPAIHSQILKTIKTLVELAERTEQKVSEDTERSREVIMQTDDSEIVTQEVAWHIGNLWNDPAIKAAYGQRFYHPQSYNLPDSTEYFFGQLHTISDAMYVPSNADLFRVRIPTTGILQTEFSLKSARFLLVDVGGQRNERRKWLHCFDNVKAVLFVVAISEYDQGLFEDSKVNRMDESLEVFNSIANEFFPETTIIIFFNKMDKFKEKVRRVQVGPLFPNFIGQEGDPDSVYEFFKGMFKDLNRSDSRRVYVHPSCATETRSVKKIFDTVRETVLRAQLKQAALM